MSRSFFEGIAIDRLDYTEYFSFKADDGVSWLPRAASSASGSGIAAATESGPAQSFRLSHRAMSQRLHEVLHPVRPRLRHCAKLVSLVLSDSSSIIRDDGQPPANQPRGRDD